MTPERNVESLFAAALERPAAERASFLDGACLGDVGLRQRVESLLVAHDSAANPLATRVDTDPAIQLSFTKASDEAVGQTLGRYRLLEKLGEGGCGVVYVAEQTEPVRRRVALKVIKLGMDTKAVIARFEAERQALAMMDHPNIARILDAGMTGSDPRDSALECGSPLPPSDTPDIPKTPEGWRTPRPAGVSEAVRAGRPYFVMELVRGIRITDYCDQNHLQLGDRLELFIKVCQAIQHAHQKGIIHRDIKPSNILVTLHDGVPVPKVIDFGIAKATEGRLTDATVYTQLHQFIGTPAYMSPEQAEMSGLDIDTRSDIYSLGVLLYELLTGVTPFDGKELVASGLDGMRKTIREQEPVRPSTRLTQIRARSAAPPFAVHHSPFPSDLDWIAMKCLEKDRTRRYETANGLAADVRRYLTSETVLARPPSTSYRLQKAFRRNRLLFLAGSTVVLALLLGVVGAGLALLKARQAEALAVRSRVEAEKLSGFMLDELHDELQPTGRFETMARLTQQVLDYYEGLPRSLRNSATELPRLTAQARLAWMRIQQGQFKAGEVLAREATTGLDQLRQQGISSERLAYALSIALHAESQYHDYAGDIGAASGPIHRAKEVLRPYVRTGDASRRTRLQYAFILGWASHAEPAEKAVVTCDEALQLLTGMGARDLSDPDAAVLWADTADSQARHLFALGRLEEAAALENQGLDLASRTAAQQPSDLGARRALWYATELLGLIHARRHQDETALDWFRKSGQFVSDYLRLNPSDGKGLQWEAVNAYCIASLLLRRGDVTEALETARAAAQRAEKDHLAEHAWGGLWTLVGVIEAQRGDRAAALEALRHGENSLEELVTRLAPTARARSFWMESIHEARRQVDLSFGNHSNTLASCQDSLRRIEDLRRNEEDGQNLAILNQRKRQALAVAALAALELKRPADAESSARALLTLPLLRTSLSERILIRQPDDSVWGRVLLAEAQLQQNKFGEALESVQPAVAYYREQRVQGATNTVFCRQLARALLAEARAQPLTSEGRARRKGSLDEALQLLRGISPQAQQLKETADLLARVEAERHPAAANSEGVHSVPVHETTTGTGLYVTYEEPIGFYRVLEVP